MAVWKINFLSKWWFLFVPCKIFWCARRNRSNHLLLTDQFWITNSLTISNEQNISSCCGLYVILLIHKIQQTSCYWNPVIDIYLQDVIHPQSLPWKLKMMVSKKNNLQTSRGWFSGSMLNFRGVDSNWLTWPRPQDIELQSQEVMSDGWWWQKNILVNIQPYPGICDLQLDSCFFRWGFTNQKRWPSVESSLPARFAFFPCGAIFESIHQMCQNSWA